MVRASPFARGVAVAAAQCSPLRAVVGVIAVVALLAFTAGAWTAAPLRSAALLCAAASDDAPHPCSRDEVLAATGGKAFPRDHPYTSRPLAIFAANAPPFLRLEPDAWDRRGAVVLDVGCGNGWALLELGSLYPRAKTACVNKEGYQWVQSESPADFALVALAHNVSVPCLHTPGAAATPGVPQLPTVALMREGVAHEPLPLSVAPDGGVDLLVSMQALNEGKVPADSPRVFLPRLLRALRPGGVASLLLSTLQQLQLEAELGAFDAIRVVHTSTLTGAPAGAPHLSVMLYGRRGVAGEDPHVGIYARRCAFGESPPPGDPAGCLFAPPTTAERVLAPTAERRAETAARAALLSPAATGAAAQAYLRMLESAGAFIRAAEERYKTTRLVTDSPTYLASIKFRLGYLTSLWEWLDSLSA